MTINQVDRYLGRVLEAIVAGEPLRIRVTAIDPAADIVTLQVLTPGVAPSRQCFPCRFFMQVIEAGLLTEVAA